MSTQQFFSLAKFPGTTGAFFYNYFFKYYGVDAEYIPKKCDNLPEDLAGIVQGGGRGVSISMPFKESVIPYLSAYSENVRKFQSCNSVKIENGKLYGESTDVAGCRGILKLVHPFNSVHILGNGSISQMFQQIFLESGINFTVYSRNLGNWGSRNCEADLTINATALGTASKESPLDCLSTNAQIVDLSLKENDLSKLCLEYGVKYFSGLHFYKFVFLEQFQFYTGQECNEQVFDDRASHFLNV